MKGNGHFIEKEDIVVTKVQERLFYSGHSRLNIAIHWSMWFLWKIVKISCWKSQQDFVFYTKNFKLKAIDKLFQGFLERDD